MVSGLSSRLHLTEVKPTSDHSDRPVGTLEHEGNGCNLEKQRFEDPRIEPTLGASQASRGESFESNLRKAVTACFLKPL